MTADMSFKDIATDTFFMVNNQNLQDFDCCC